MLPERELLAVREIAAPSEGRRGGVRRASLKVSRGEMVAILGRSGSGKSALLRVCGGVQRPQFGHVLVGGVDLDDLDPDAREAILRSTVGWVFQSPRLVPLLTAEENVALAMRVAGAAPAEALAMSREALQAVGLAEQGERQVSELSRGERQRVALARALAKAPALIIADEPTAQLDAATATEILSLLADAAHSGVAVLFSTHDDAEAARAQRFLVLEEGVLRAGKAVRERAAFGRPRPPHPEGLRRTS